MLFRNRETVDNVEELEKAMGTPAPERVRQYRRRLREQGRTRLSIFLTPDARAALSALREQHPGTNVNDLVSGVLTGRIPTRQPEHRP